MMQFDVQKLRGNELEPIHKQIIWTLLSPVGGAQGSEEEIDDLYRESTFCHEESDCIWLFLRVWKAGRLSAEDGSSRGKFIGIATGAPHHRSFYVFNLFVLPAFRRKGCGEKLLRECQALAQGLGLHALSGSVDSSQQSLIQWYSRFGGSISRTFCSSDSQLPPSVPMECHFKNEDVEAALRLSNARLHKNLNRHCSILHQVAPCLLLVLGIAALAGRSRGAARSTMV